MSFLGIGGPPLFAPLMVLVTVIATGCPWSWAAHYLACSWNCKEVRRLVATGAVFIDPNHWAGPLQTIFQLRGNWGGAELQVGTSDQYECVRVTLTMLCENKALLSCSFLTGRILNSEQMTCPGLPVLQSFGARTAVEIYLDPSFGGQEGQGATGPIFAKGLLALLWCSGRANWHTGKQSKKTIYQEPIP